MWWKRGVKYFAKALAKEAEESKKDIIVGMLSPGIMKTNFLDNAFGNEKIELDDKKRKVYDILGDYPDVVAKYLVNKMITNNDNNVNTHIWRCSVNKSKQKNACFARFYRVERRVQVPLSALKTPNK